MRLSTVFELLLIFLLIAFAAYGRVIDRDETSRAVAIKGPTKQNNVGANIMSLKQASENVNKYCTCDKNICNCCRDFNIPIVLLKGPACASLQYLENENLAVQLSMGDRVLTSTVVNGKKPRPVCVPMPGGLTKFCGRLYSIKREANDHFKVCLALELQSSAELEAALRVNCFRFGPDGVQLRPAERLPIVEPTESSQEDDDDDDIFGLDDDDDEDEDEDAPEGNAVPDSASTNSEDDDDDDDDDDLLGFGALLDIFTGDSSSNKKKKKPEVTPSSIIPFTIPIPTKPTATVPPVSEIIENSVTPKTDKPIHATSPKPTIDILTSEVTTVQVPTILPEKIVPTTPKSSISQALHAEESSLPEALMESVTEDIVTESSADVEIIGNSNDIKEESYIAEPVILKKVTNKETNNKISLTSSSINAIKTDVKKPSSVVILKVTRKPVKLNIPASSEQANEDEDDVDLFSDEDDEDENIEEDSNEDDNDEDDHKNDEINSASVDEDSTESNKIAQQHNDDDDDEEEEVTDLIGDDDEEEEEEDAVLSAIVEDETHDSDKIKDKVVDNEATNDEEEDADYGFGLPELLARKRQMRSGRQSKVMRL